MEPQEQVFTFLRDLGIPFDLVRHAPVDTMEDCAALGLSAPHCKNLFLCNRAKTQFYLLLLRADKPFVTREVSKTLGVSRLSFGDADALARLLHTHPGAVSPLGLLFPESAGVRLLCDEDLRPLPALAFHPLTNEASLTMSTADFFGKFLPAARLDVTFLPISGPADAI